MIERVREWSGKREYVSYFEGDIHGFSIDRTSVRIVPTDYYALVELRNNKIDGFGSLYDENIEASLRFEEHPLTSADYQGGTI